MASQAVYGLVLSFRRWTVKARLRFILASVSVGILGFFVATTNAPYAELWTNQLWAGVLMVYIASCLVIWQNRDSRKLSTSTWRERIVAFLLSQLFYFSSVAVMSWASGHVLDSPTFAEFAVIVPFTFGCVIAYTLSHTRLHSWPHTVLLVQVFWFIAYLIEFVVNARFGGFWAIPFLAVMFFFLPAITILVSIGAWLGYRSAQFRHVPRQASWAESSLDRNL